MTLKEWLFRKNMKLIQFAELTGISRTFLSRVKNARVMPGAGTIAIIERATSGAVKEKDYK